MAAVVSVKVIGGPALQHQLMMLDPKQNRRIMAGSLRRAADRIHKVATREKIRRGHRKSPPIPNVLTSRNEGRGLIGSIAVNQGPMPKAIEVGTHLLYGRFHELGEGGMPARPFLAPALADVSKEFGKIVFEEWEKALR